MTEPEPDPRAMWELVTERENETARFGIGDDELRKTLRHLRDRGDGFACWRVRGSASPWTEVNLRTITV